MAVPSRLLRFVAFAIVFAVCVVATIALNRPTQERLAFVRKSLAAEGYPDAQVGRQQNPSDMSECGVGQITNRGYAYPWTSGATEGVYCAPLDGRPARIVLHTTSGAFARDVKK